MSQRAFLVFRLDGPMFAFGEIAVGERRSLWDAPSKSGVLGLVAACLGLKREDHEALTNLDASLGFAVRVDHSGVPLRDYHTAQAPTAASRKRREKAGLTTSTRKTDLESDDLNTVLSERLYRLEASFTIALWIKPDCNADLEKLEQALLRPVYAPYLGRKACPLGAPPRPHILDAPGLIAAFDAYDAVEESVRLILKAKTRWPDKTRLRWPNITKVWFECDAGLTDEEAATNQIRLRRDALRRRDLWQFFDRREGLLEWRPPIVGVDRGETAA